MLKIRMSCIVSELTKMSVFWANVDANLMTLRILFGVEPETFAI